MDPSTNCAAENAAGLAGCGGALMLWPRLAATKLPASCGSALTGGCPAATVSGASGFAFRPRVLLLLLLLLRLPVVDVLTSACVALVLLLLPVLGRTAVALAAVGAPSAPADVAAACKSAGCEASACCC